MLVAAIKSGNNGCIAALLDSGAEVNYVEHIDEHEEETHVFGYLLNIAAHMSVPLLMFQTVDDVLLNAVSNIGQCMRCEKLTGEAGNRTDIAKIYHHCIRQDETPLAEAVVNDNLSPEVTSQALDIVHLLLCAGAHMTTDCGRFTGFIHVTVAEYIVLLNKVPFMELFLEYSFDLNEISTTIVAKADRDILLTLLHAGLHHSCLTQNPLWLVQVAGGNGYSVPDDAKEEHPTSLMYVCCMKIRQCLVAKYKENIVFCVENYCNFLPQVVRTYLLCGEKV